MVLQLPMDDPVAPALPVVQLKPMKSGMQKMIFMDGKVPVPYPYQLPNDYLLAPAVPDLLLKPMKSGTFAAAVLYTMDPAVPVILHKMVCIC